ncbi:carboxypeptidase-like regulatory domain-containing protein [Flammeovirgaceae bacterium SG7u.111]|nr:carboxypeptidase-like regulatory domain-containing protein [Flammeovirgaceae bacterium SG7u.132]WPO37403.1 carboxypeptidase-like regulatory domain-containing protein [Flammeovirgaceae bacterium SG7u.111]
MYLKLTVVIWCAFLFMSIHVDTLAQSDYTTITGKILNKKTKEPIPFASIYLKNTSNGTRSNSEGVFVFHIPKNLHNVNVVVSSIGYNAVERLPSVFEKENVIYLEESVLELNEVVISAEEQLTAKQIIKRAYKLLEENYPTSEYILEGFIRDLQNEDSSYVEFLECAVKLKYQKYNVKFEPQVELQEVRRSFIANKNPWNDEWDRKNLIFDIIEDDFIRFNYGPIKVKKGWDYEVESVLPFGNSYVYKINAGNKGNSKAVLFIDIDTFAFVRIEYSRSMRNGKYYSRRLSNGQQEKSYNLVVEYQEYKGKWYLKYQKEEDSWSIFKGLESDELLFTKYPKKELFINKIIAENVNQYLFNKNLVISKSVESQAKPYNPEFWEHYNAPAQTYELSKIEEFLKQATNSAKE